MFLKRRIDILEYHLISEDNSNMNTNVSYHIKTHKDTHNQLFQVIFNLTLVFLNVRHVILLSPYLINVIFIFF